MTTIGRVMWRLFARPPFNSPWVAATVSRYGLVTWFAIESVLAVAVVVLDPRRLFFDARLYLDATRMWLAGGNPWDVVLFGNYFAAPPPTLLPFVPFALLPPDLGVALVALAVCVGAFATVRLLHLPWWWLLFPPLVQCVLAANVQALLVPLILLPGGALAVLLKIYAGFPLAILGRWRSLLVAAAVLGATLPVLPWSTYISEFALISQRLADQSKYTLPMELLLLLAPLTLAALVVVGRERAAWLIVPAIWPSQQFYYGTLAMPTKSKIATALIALPVPGNGLLALGALAVVTLQRGDRDHWRPAGIRWRRVDHRMRARPDSDRIDACADVFIPGATIGLGTGRIGLVESGS